MMVEGHKGSSLWNQLLAGLGGSQTAQISADFVYVGPAFRQAVGTTASTTDDDGGCRRRGPARNAGA